MKSFSEYKKSAPQWITVFETGFYPDYLDEANITYAGILQRFIELVNELDSSPNLLRKISDEPPRLRVQLLRIFRKYVSPDTSVEMLKVKGKTESIIEVFGPRFRSIEKVREKLKPRAFPDEVLSAILYEYKDRGKKGYELTEAFFTWFESKFDQIYKIEGPRGAGKDLMLNEFLDKFEHPIPSDFIISGKSGKPIVIGFARYDSDRGGSQEDDRTGGNRDKITDILRYAKQHDMPLKVLFVNDGPGLSLGSMWNDYALLEEYGGGNVLVCTLKMLNERLTQEWMES